MKKRILKVVLKCFVHGIGFSVLITVWLALLFAFGSSFLLAMFVSCMMMFPISACGYLNSVLTDLLWFPVKSSFWNMVLHGFVLFVILAIVNYAYVWTPLVLFRNVNILVLGIVLVSFLNGAIGRTVARVWKKSNGIKQIRQTMTLESSKNKK